MNPIGNLMTEHRLIERMVNIMKIEIDKIKSNQKIDPLFIDTTVDFFRSFSQRHHEEKEETILFAELAKKDLSNEDKTMMEKLIKEHADIRECVGKLIDYKHAYVMGDNKALEGVINEIELLIQAYPSHIQIEDKNFFIPSMNYFTEEEKTQIEQQFIKFDQSMIFLKYTEIIKALEKTYNIA